MSGTKRSADEPAEGGEAQKLSRKGTIAQTVADAKKFLGEEEAAAGVTGVPAPAGTAKAAEGGLPKATTMAATVAEAKEFLNRDAKNAEKAANADATMNDVAPADDGAADPSTKEKMARKGTIAQTVEDAKKFLGDDAAAGVTGTPAPAGTAKAAEGGLPKATTMAATVAEAQSFLNRDSNNDTAADKGDADDASPAAEPAADEAGESANGDASKEKLERKGTIAQTVEDAKKFLASGSEKEESLPSASTMKETVEDAKKFLSR